MKQQQTRPSPVSWLAAKGEDLAQAAIAAIPDNGSAAMKAAEIQKLVETLQRVREFDRWDRFSMSDVVRKENYGWVGEISCRGCSKLHGVLPDGRIVGTTHNGVIQLLSRGKNDQWSSEALEGHTGRVYCLQALPDGGIVTGSDDNKLRIWGKGDDGKWSAEVLAGHTDLVRCLQALPDGRIVSGSDDKTLRIWSKGGDGKWSAEVLEGHTAWIFGLQALPDGRIISGGEDKTIRIWSKGVDGKWNCEALLGHIGPVNCLQALSDGRIVSGSDNGTLRIWSVQRDGSWSSQVFKAYSSWYAWLSKDYVTCLQTLPDGRIVSANSGGGIFLWTERRASWPSRLRTLSFSAKTEWVSQQVNRSKPQGWVDYLQVLPDGRIFSGIGSFLDIWDGKEVKKDGCMSK